MVNWTSPPWWNWFKLPTGRGLILMCRPQSWLNLMQVINIKHTIYAFCRYHRPYQALKIWNRSIKYCSWKAGFNVFEHEVTWLHLLTWPWMILVWNFNEMCGKDVAVGKGVPKTAAGLALLAKETEWVFKPPSAGRGIIMIYSCGMCEGF